MNQTIAQQLNIKEFPFIIRDKNGNVIYWEYQNKFWWKAEYNSDGQQTYFENSENVWWKAEYNSDGQQTYFENSEGKSVDKRSKSCEDKVIEIDGIKYKLVKV